MSTPIEQIIAMVPEAESEAEAPPVGPLVLAVADAEAEEQEEEESEEMEQNSDESSDASEESEQNSDESSDASEESEQNSDESSDASEEAHLVLDWVPVLAAWFGVRSEPDEAGDRYVFLRTSVDPDEGWCVSMSTYSIFRWRHVQETMATEYTLMVNYHLCTFIKDDGDVDDANDANDDYDGCFLFAQSDAEEIDLTVVTGDGSGVELFVNWAESFRDRDLERWLPVYDVMAVRDADGTCKCFFTLYGGGPTGGMMVDENGGLHTWHTTFGEPIHTAPVLNQTLMSMENVDEEPEMRVRTVSVDSAIAQRGGWGSAITYGLDEIFVELNDSDEDVGENKEEDNQDSEPEDMRFFLSETCAICISEFSVADLCVQWACGHCVHAECYQELRQAHGHDVRRCVSCRQQSTPLETKYRVYDEDCDYEIQSSDSSMGSHDKAYLQMPIFVKTLAGNTITIITTPSSRVIEVKAI
jgi:hypothetical protein